MRNIWKAALAALSITAFAGVAGSASAQPYGYDNYDRGYDNRYDTGYGDPGYGGDQAYDPYGYGMAPDGVPYDVASGGYCDEWGCPDDYYDLPVYYGPVYYGGSWFNGPLYYRDWYGSRQYWVRGGWHNDGWRGARPSWYRQGRYGPALGRSFYGSDRFRSHAYNNRGFNNRGNYGRTNAYGGNFNRNDNRGFNGANRNGNRGFQGGGNGSRFGNRGFAAQPQAQQDRGQRFGGQRSFQGQRQGFQGSNAARPDVQNRGGFQNRSSVQRSEARPQFQRGNGGGNRGNRGDRNR